MATSASGVFFFSVSDAEFGEILFRYFYSNLNEMSSVKLSAGPVHGTK